MITKALREYSDDEIFSLLDADVKKWFKKKFKTFTPPQRYAIHEINKRRNILISSPTGSGKTLSAFLGIIDYLVKLHKSKKIEDRVYAIYISPLRALNNDIKRNLLEPLRGIKNRIKDLDIRIAVRTSDTSPSEKSKMLRKPPHILITTPESFAIGLNSQRFSSLIKNAEYAIVDEIHAVAENKRGSHLSLSLERLQHKADKEIVRIGLSATVHPLSEVAKFLVGEGRSCKIVDVNYAKKTHIEVISPVDDFIYTPPDVANKSMYELLDKLIDEHETTLIFTNTRSATERVVFHLKSMFGDKYVENIAAHHSSLSRDIRLDVEEKLKRGELKVVVSSTSLELGIDIGAIDLVVLLGSPKSVSRALQRIGRSGHKLHEVSKGVLVVLDRDDLVECTVLAYNARKRKFDKIRIPKNPLDVLVQHVLGMALERKWKVKEALKVIRKSYSFSSLSKEDFVNVLRYLAGYYDELEVRNVYGKIWFDEEKEEFGKRGKMSRVIYFMNTGTIPDESAVPVFLRNNKFIGKLEEEFVERLMPGDRFVLGGKTYEFVHSRGNKVYVDVSTGKPTIPSWFSEMLPLSYELALDIERFRHEALNLSVNELMKKYRVDERTARAIKNYIKEQAFYSTLPSAKTFLVEEYIDEDLLKNYIFHSLAGRKANEALSRAFAHYIGKKKRVNVRVTFSDYGFILTLGRWKRISEEDIVELLNMSRTTFLMNLKEAVERSELMRRRFRNVAVRGLMILRRYPGRTLTIGRQQMSADSLLKLVKMFYPHFPILKETYREIFEDVMHVDEALDYLNKIKSRKLVFERDKKVPSPFAFNLVALGARDVVVMEDRKAFIRRLHERLVKRWKK